MSFQIRNPKYGLFQGAEDGYAAFYPYSQVPHLGIYKFDTFESAKLCVEFLTSHPLFKDDLFLIQEYDKNLSQEIMMLGGIKQISRMVKHSMN